MKTFGRVLILLGVILFGVTAVLRRIMKPEDWENWMGHRSSVLIPMSLGVALIVAGYFVMRRAETTRPSAK